MADSGAILEKLLAATQQAVVHTNGNAKLNFDQFVTLLGRLEPNLTTQSVSVLFHKLAVIDVKDIVRYVFDAGSTAPALGHSTVKDATANSAADTGGSTAMTEEQAYAKVEEEMGGRYEIEIHKKRSDRLKKEIQRRNGDKDPWRHDVIVHHLGLDGLIRVGKAIIKPQFDALVKKVANKFGAVPLIPDVKGKERSEVKVNVKYGGDASQLSDILRATLQFKMHSRVVKDMYDAVEELVFMYELSGVRATVTFFDDKYQSPFPTGYKHLLCLLKINGYTCELQLNVDEILKVKEGFGHKQYEHTRKINDEVIHAAMKNDISALTVSLKSGADPNANRDMHGLTSIHYAAHHGHVEMVDALIACNANVFAHDNEGLLPIQRAVLLGHVQVAETLLVKMEAAGEDCPLHSALTGDLAAAALETAPDGSSLPTDLVQRLVKWEAAHFPDGSALWHRWAVADRSGAFTAIQGMHDLQAKLGPLDQPDESGCTPMDYAIRHQSSVFAEKLLVAGCRATRPYLNEHLSPKMADVLQKHCPEEPMAKSRDAIQNTNLFKATLESDIMALEVFLLDGCNFSQVDQDGLTPFERALDTHQFPAIEFILDFTGWLDKSVFDWLHCCAWAKCQSAGDQDAWGTCWSGGDTEASAIFTSSDAYHGQLRRLQSSLRPVEEIVPDFKSYNWRAILERLRGNKKYVMTAVEHNWRSLQFASEELKNDAAIVQAAVEKNGTAIQYASEEMKNNAAIVQAAVEQNWEALQYASEEMKNSAAIVQAAVEQNWEALQDAGEKMKNNAAIVQAAIEQNGTALQYASEEMKNNAAIVQAAIEQDARALEYASAEMKNNAAIVLAAVKRNGWMLPDAGEEMKNNAVIVQAAIEQDGMLLQHVGEEMKNNPAIVQVAVDDNMHALQYASEEMKNNAAIVQAAVEKHGFTLSYAGEEMKNNAAVVQAAVEQDATALEYASEEMKNNAAIVLAAVKRNGTALQFASEEMKNEPSMLLAAFQQMGMKFDGLTVDEMKNSAAIVQAAVMQHGGVLLCASEKMMKNEVIVIAAIRSLRQRLDGESLDEYGPGRLWSSLPEEMKQNEQVFIAAGLKEFEGPPGLSIFSRGHKEQNEMRILFSSGFQLRRHPSDLA